MKKLLLIMLGALFTLPAATHDFEYTYEGQTITYTVLDEEAKTCMTKQGDYAAGNAVAGELTIPAIAKDGDTEYTVTSIGDKAFYMCGSLTSVELPNSITSIGDKAFSNCFKLSSIYIPTSVTSIGNRAFQNCETFTSIEIPGSVTSIDYAPFMDCRRLKSIEISAENPNYASIDGVMFNKDISTLIQFPGGNTEYVIPNSVTSIETQAFSCCRYLTSVEIPNSVTSIGESAFYMCTSLTSVEIPNSVTLIGKGAFVSCRGLTSVKIPSSVASIGNDAFYLCNALASVYYGADEPIECDIYIFSPITYTSATLYMTETGAEKSRTINPWMNFTTIEVYDFPDGIEEIETDANAPCEVYSLSGAKVGDSTDALAPGIYIVRQGAAVKKVAIK